jgi:small-conductance mechanosensitive channel
MKSAWEARFEFAAELIAGSEWWSSLARIVLFYAIAWVIHLLSHRLSRRLVLLSQVAPKARRPRSQRRQTLENLIASAISVVAFLVATLATLAQFIETTDMIWLVGLLSAGFGLGARPLISDVLAGINLIFEDTYAVGEKVELLGAEGVVEAVNLRTTCLRSPQGELFIIPNGDVRMVRNFSRGSFSPANITVRMASVDLSRALPLLEELGEEAAVLLPNLLEAWQVISESGSIGQVTELKLVARARFGRSAEMRPRMLSLIQDRLSEIGIALVD